MDDFATLVARHDRSLRALAYRLLDDRDLMDDALQDAYTKAYRGYGRFRGDSDPGTWLYRIVYNACVDARRSAARHRHGPLDGDEDSRLPTVPFDDPSLGTFGDLAGALARLPVDQRAVVLLVDAEGFDYAAAAEVLDVPVGTVASRLARARAALRRDVEGST